MQKIIGAIGGFINGFFGSGGGILVLFDMQKRCENKKCANGSCLCVIFPLTIISLAIFLFQYKLNLYLCFKVCIGAVAGGVIGAKLLNKIKYKYIAIIYCVVMVISGVYMIFRR